MGIERVLRCGVLGVALLVVCAGSFAGERSSRDVLPRTFREMSRYDQIAMEPHRGTYDAMPIHEKAEKYAEVFRFMNNREPNFGASLNAEIERSASLARTQSSYDRRQYMYKAPPPEIDPGVDEETLLQSLSGPWAGERAAAPDPGADDRRMESLRHGWSAKILRENGR